MTPAELVRLPDRGRGYELIDGVPVERVVPMPASDVAGKLLCELMGRGDERFPIWVACAYPFACFPGSPSTVRRPSVVGVLNARTAAWPDGTDDPCTIVPDVVAEVVYRRPLAGDTPRPHEEFTQALDTEERAVEWLRAGVPLVWAVDVPSRAVRAYRPDVRFTDLKAGDTLTADPVLPGFSCPVADLFRRPGEPPAV